MLKNSISVGEKYFLQFMLKMSIVLSYLKEIKYILYREEGLIFNLPVSERLRFQGIFLEKKKSMILENQRFIYTIILQNMNMLLREYVFFMTVFRVWIFCVKLLSIKRMVIRIYILQPNRPQTLYPCFFTTFQKFCFVSKFCKQKNSLHTPNVWL